MTPFAARYGPWALVTGASAGLGAEFARQLAARGVSSVLVARRRERMEALAQELRGEHGVDARVLALDLSRDDFMEELEPALEGLDLGLLVNNAGFGLAGTLLEHDLSDELDMLYVNCRAPLILTHSLVPRLLARGRGGVVFVSSVAGYLPLPGLGHYAATKAWDLFLGEALWGEVGGKGVDVINLCPGPTRTEFSEVAGFGGGDDADASSGGSASPEPVVRLALDGLGARPSVVHGLKNRLQILGARLLPDSLRLSLTAKAMGVDRDA